MDTATAALVGAGVGAFGSVAAQMVSGFLVRRKDISERNFRLRHDIYLATFRHLRREQLKLLDRQLPPGDAGRSWDDLVIEIQFAGSSRVYGATLEAYDAMIGLHSTRAVRKLEPEIPAATKRFEEKLARLQVLMATELSLRRLGDHP